MCVRASLHACVLRKQCLPNSAGFYAGCVTQQTFRSDFTSVGRLYNMPGEKSRGEIGEIRTQLNALSASGSRPEAATAKKELFKKVINCMTIGIDMSSLFMQVMTAGMSNAEDVVLKKMLYLFICTYAQSNPDLTLLTINLLNKDCKDQDPTIRGLALRSLCSLRVANLIEYIVSGQHINTSREVTFYNSIQNLLVDAGLPSIAGTARPKSICSTHSSIGRFENIQS